MIIHCKIFVPENLQSLTLPMISTPSYRIEAELLYVKKDIYIYIHTYTLWSTMAYQMALSLVLMYNPHLNLYY